MMWYSISGFVVGWIICNLTWHERRARKLKALDRSGVGGPTYYVRHPDESYSEALPQPSAAATCANDAIVPLQPLPDHVAPEHRETLQRLSDEARRERAAFEAWAVKTHGKLTLSDPDAGAMWSAWKARATGAAVPGGTQRLVQEIEREFVALEDLPAWIRRLQDQLREARAAAGAKGADKC